MKVLVTGAGGFLGLHLVEKLAARGDAVRAVVRHSRPNFSDASIETVVTDLADRAKVIEACRGVDVVFHVAGQSGIWGPWSWYYRNNVLSTKHLIEGCWKHRVRRLVFTSSPSVAFDGTDQEKIDETTGYPKKWLCHYAHTKAIAERAVLEANGEGKLATCALRPHLIWGPGDRSLIPRLFHRARRRQLVQIGDGSNRVDTVYVENAADAHIAAASALDSPTSAPAGKAYFISQDEPVGCWQWINRLLSLENLPPIEKKVSLKFAYRCGAFMETAYKFLRLKDEPPLTRFLALQLGRSHYFDISRARNDFGYTPTVSTEEGLKRLKSSLS